MIGFPWLIRIQVLLVFMSGCATLQTSTLDNAHATNEAPTVVQASTVRHPLDIPKFDVHTLENGLRIITIEDHSFPIVGLTAYVTTGGRTEDTHYAGALHYIEHLVFKGGTARFPPKFFRKKIAELGDENGGWTWDDEIQFGFEVPKQNFDEALDVFAESLLELQWEENWFEAERKVVLQEIEKISEQPWHKVWTAWDSLAFTKHPYGRPVIGTARSIKGQTMAELERYYRDRFTPNHLILIIAGDFNTQTLIKKITHRFSKYAAGPDSFELPDVREPPQENPRIHSLTSQDTTNTKFLVGFRTPKASHEDTMGLLLLSQIINSPTIGLPAYLKRKRQWVTSVEASYTFMVDYGHLTIEGETQPKNAGKVLLWLREWLTDLHKTPISKQTIADAAHSVLIKRGRSWETYGDMAQGVGFWIERMGVDATRKSTARLLAYTPKSLASIARKYLTRERWVETVMTPKGSPSSIGDENVGKSNPAPPMPNLNQPGLLHPTGKASWRWNKNPGVPNSVVHYEFDSGLDLIVAPRSANALVHVVAHIAGGQWVEPADKGGINMLTARMLTSGTKNLSVAQWDRALAANAIEQTTSLQFGQRSNIARNVHYRDGATLSFSGTTSQWDTLLALMGEALIRPRFSSKNVDKKREVMLSEVESLREDNLEFIKQEFYKLAYPNHPYSRPTIGGKKSLKSISSSDIIYFHEKTYAPDRTAISITGNVDPDVVADFIANRWNDWDTPRAGPLPKRKAIEHRPNRKRRKVIKLNKSQWCINYGYPTLTAANPKFTALEVLFGIVRGRHFYKYVYDRAVSYRSWIKLWGHLGPSAWITENDIAKQTFESTMAAIERDFQTYALGTFTEEEVRLARTRLINRDVLDYQNGRLLAFRMARNQSLKLGYERTLKRQSALKAVKRADINRLSRSIFGQRNIYRLQLR